jgi:hypothetical protein
VIKVHSSFEPWFPTKLPADVTARAVAWTPLEFKYTPKSTPFQSSYNLVQNWEPQVSTLRETVPARKHVRGGFIKSEIL